MSVLQIEDTDNARVSPEDVRRLIDATRVQDVRLDEVHAGPVGVLSEDMSINVEVDEPQFARMDESSAVLIRLTHRITCTTEGAVDRATHIQVSHVLTLQVVSDLTTNWAAVAAWVETNLYFLVYPYVRQSVSTLTTSLGMPAVVLGYLSRDERPLSIFGEAAKS